MCRIIVLWCLLCSIVVKSQNKEEKSDSVVYQIFPTAQRIQMVECTSKRAAILDIQKVTLIDTFLIRQIDILISEMKTVDSLFKKGIGFIDISISHFVDGQDQGRYYYIKPDIYSFRDPAEAAYPIFYSYVSGRIVLVHIQNLDESVCYRISNRSKRRLKKLVEPFLEKPKNVVFRDPSTGKKEFRDRKFRIDYSYLHGGKDIYIYNDRPPIVRPDLGYPGRKEQ